MKDMAYYIILEDTVLLSKKDYGHWREIQDEYYDNYRTSLGPWTCDDLISYFEDDFKAEDNWPFSRETITNFFNDKVISCYSER